MVEYHSRISYNNNCFATYILFFFFFNDTATTEIYTLPLHDALPISDPGQAAIRHAAQAAERDAANLAVRDQTEAADPDAFERSEEHTSELQSPCNLVCRLLLEKKKHDNLLSSSLCDHTTRLVCVVAR